LEEVIGIKVNVRDPIHPLQSHIFRCHPNLYSNNKQPIPWYDFTNILSNMGGNVHDKYPARMRVFCQATLPNGKQEFIAMIQEFTKNEKKERTSSKLMPFLPQDKLFNNYRLVLLSSMESISVLHCKFPQQTEDCCDLVILPPQQRWNKAGWKYNNL
jgi:hypothetical protein